MAAGRELNDMRFKQKLLSELQSLASLFSGSLFGPNSGGQPIAHNAHAQTRRVWEPDDN